MTRPSLPDHVERVLSLVCDGLSQKEAAARVGYTVRGMDNWRRRYPEFNTRMRAALDYAAQTRGSRDKLDLLAWMRAGRSVATWFGGPGAERGITSGVLRGWLRQDRHFNAEYKRLLGPTGRITTGQRLEMFLADLQVSGSVRASCRRSGIATGTVGAWRAEQPELWARVDAARSRGRAARRAGTVLSEGQAA